MIEFLRSLFGWSRPVPARTVLGHPQPVNSREAAYIRDSNGRLSALFQLANRFGETPCGPKLRSVYEKTKTIHTYLVNRKRIRELELFHMQNTDHFISTFTAILDAHARLTARSRTEKSPTHTQPGGIADGQQPASHSNGRLLGIANPAGNQIPRLTAPEIHINPTARILYHLPEPTPQGQMTREIALTSPAEDKESFLAHVAARFGITNFTYLGNALVNIPDTTGPTPTGLVAIIHWQGHPYALNFTDGRLFPVKRPTGTRK